MRHPTWETGEQIDKTVEDAKIIRDELAKAKAVKCTCGGFVLQYEGCQCERIRQIAMAKKKRDNFFESL